MSENSSKAVYLLHGIRDFGGWTSHFKSVFSEAGIKADSRHLGWIAPWHFIAPGQVYSDHEKRILVDLERYKDKQLTIIAHSFGTWIISRLLSDNPTIKVRRLILCNGVVPQHFEWHNLTNVEEILCICGNRDYWPCVAEMISSRFGACGTRGCQHPRVADLHFDIRHGDCLKPAFCRRHFLPLVLKDTPITGGTRAESRGVRFLQYVNENRIFVPIFVVAVILAWLAAPTSVVCALSRCFVDIVRTEDFRDSMQDGSPRSYVRDIIQSYSFNYDPGDIEINIKKTHDCRIVQGKETYSDPLIQAQVFNMLSNPSEPLGVEDRNDCFFRHSVAVQRRSAVVRIRYMAADVAPAGGGVMIPFAVRNLTYTVAPVRGTTLVPSIQKISDAVYRAYARVRGGEPLVDDAGVEKCRPIAPAKDGDSYQLVCPGVWLMPAGLYLLLGPGRFFHGGDAFVFCFTLAGWKGPNPGDDEKGGECLRAPPPKH